MTGKQFALQALRRRVLLDTSQQTKSSSLGLCSSSAGVWKVRLPKDMLHDRKVVGLDRHRLRGAQIYIIHRNCLLCGVGGSRYGCNTPVSECV